MISMMWREGEGAGEIADSVSTAGAPGAGKTFLSFLTKVDGLWLPNSVTFICIKPWESVPMGCYWTSFKAVSPKVGAIS